MNISASEYNHTLGGLGHGELLQSHFRRGPEELPAKRNDAGPRPRWTVPPPKGGGAVIEASLGSKDLARPSMLTGMQIIYVVNHKGLSTFGLGRYSDRHSAGSLGENLGQAQNGIQSFCVQCD